MASLGKRSAFGLDLPGMGLVTIGALITAVASSLLVFLPNPWLPFIALAALVAGAWAWRQPGVVLAAYLYIPFYKGALDPILPIDLTFLLGGVCTLLVARWAVPKLTTGLRSVLITWGALSGLIVLGVLYSPDTKMAMAEGLIPWLTVAVPLLLAVLVAIDHRWRLQFIWASVSVSCALILLSAPQLGDSSAFSRISIAGSNTIGTGRGALIMLVLIPVLWGRLRPMVRLVYASLAFAGLVVAVGTGSRGPVVAMVVAWVLIQITSWKRLWTLLGWSLLAILAFVVMWQTGIIAAFVSETAVYRFESLIDALRGRGNLDASSLARLDLYRLAIQMFEDRPLIGGGTASFAHATQSSSTLFMHTYPHNFVLQIAAEFGMAGLILLTGMMGLAGRGLLRATSWSEQAVAMLAMFAIVSAFFSNGIYDNRWLWGMVLMAASLPYVRSPANNRTNGRNPGPRSPSPGHSASVTAPAASARPASPPAGRPA